MDLQKKYKPEDREKHLYHVELDKSLYDTKTGKKLSKEFIQKFTETEFKMFEQSNRGLGYTVKVLWKPENNK